MSSIKLSDIRISGFRGLKDISTSLEKVTVLTGCNNVGKTSILKALQLALGNAAFLTQEDFFVNEEGPVEKIIIDVCFISVNENGERIDLFSEEWESIFTESCIQNDVDGKAFVGLRTIFNYDATISNFSRKQKILQRWKPADGEMWQDIGAIESKFKRDSIPFFYIEAQRDIVEDTKLRTSFIGKLLADVAKSYTPEKVLEIEEQIKLLNESTINNSTVLNDVQTTLKEIESAIDNDNSEVSITPFTKKLRDLNKGITIHYGNSTNSYTMDYHGMGTRSWSSLLTFKSFILQHKKVADAKNTPFYPIITIEEPEAHLHPDAQKRLYQQIAEMPGQKIISTHSPYIASTAQLCELRNMYKNNDVVLCKSLDVGSLDMVEVRALKQKVINTKGEIIFAKALVLFEGETEDQALPIFAEKYFNCNPVSLGLEFASVGGSGKYYPFMYLAEKFNIPWYIFSDGEDKTIRGVLNAYNKVKNTTEIDINNISNIFVISNGSDFEKMLINDGYVSEIEFCLKELLGNPNCVDDCISRMQGTSAGRVPTSETCPQCHQKIYIDTIRDFTGADGRNKALDLLMEKHKVDFAPMISQKITEGSSGLPSVPPLVKQLFDKIKADLHICQQ